MDSNSSEDRNLSHKKCSSFIERIQFLKEKVIARDHLPHATVEQQLDLIDQIEQSDLGKFLLERRGLNGYWTHYIVTHPQNGRKTGLNHVGKPFSNLEKFMLDRAPTSLATQQRFEIFKNTIQKKVESGMNFASIPCGVMGDLLELDFSRAKEFQLTGIDIDTEALEQAEEIAKEKKLSSHCKFMKRDAWNLQFQNAFDLITSNGLTVYESSDEKIIHLYKEFYKALKPNGLLVTSFLTPPPVPGIKTEWNLNKIDLKDAQLQNLLFADLLECNWQVYRQETTVRDQLAKAGFSDIEVIYDAGHIFPTIVAKKLSFQPS